MLSGGRQAHDFYEEQVDDRGTIRSTNEREQLMAKIEIESAFVESWTKTTDQHPAWGMKTAEPHSRKNDDGKYETVGRTFRTVKVSRASGIDLSVFVKGDRVQVWGKEVTETREHEGKSYYDLIVWADRVEVAGSGRSGDTRQSGDVSEPWATDTSSNLATPQEGAQGHWGSTTEVPF